MKQRLSDKDKPMPFRAWMNLHRRWTTRRNESRIRLETERYAGLRNQLHYLKYHWQADSRSKKTKSTNEPRERKNRAVYVTNLPLDADLDEVEHVFKRCGQIAENIDDDGPRIKLYTDDQDRFKGDALVVYFRPESVELAIQMLDDTDFRLGQELPAGKMRVAVADYSYKRQTEAPSQPKQRDKKRIIKKTQKLNRYDI
jgi:HIV Tat-specific factor 1